MGVDSKGGRARGDLDVIPEELHEFLKTAPSSLLIKGATGTGKTTLALAILHHLDARDGFLYLSTRESLSEMLRCHRWLREWMRPAGGRRRGARSGQSAAAAAAVLTDSFVDSRLDEPTQLFERITNQLMEAISPTIVIDTWDSLSDFKEEDSLQSNLRVLLAWCERAGARLILLGEDPAVDKFDALVDGVVVLERREIDGRRSREIVFPKLRGTDIRNPSYFFTLKDARFRSFRRTGPDYLTVEPGASSPVPGAAASSEGFRSGGYLPTGHAALDSDLGGGFPAGSLVNLALANGVDPRVPLFLLESTLGAFLSSGRRAVLVPFEGLAPGFVEGYLSWAVPSAWRGLVRQEWKRNGAASDPADTKGGGGEEEEEEGEEDGKGPSLVILGPGAIQEREVRRLASAVQAAAGLGFVVTRDADSAIAGRLSENSASVLRITAESGTLLLRPQFPSTKLYVIDVRRESGRPLLRLEPMV